MNTIGVCKWNIATSNNRTCFIPESSILANCSKLFKIIENESQGKIGAKNRTTVEYHGFAIIKRGTGCDNEWIIDSCADFNVQVTIVHDFNGTNSLCGS